MSAGRARTRPLSAPNTTRYWWFVIAVLVIGAGTGLWLRGWCTPWVSRIDPAHEQRAAEAEASVTAKDTAIRGLAAEIKRLRAVADAEGRARAQAEQRADAFAARARDLDGQLVRIEAERQAMTRATSVGQVREGLARRGIVAK